MSSLPELEPGSVPAALLERVQAHLELREDPLCVPANDGQLFFTWDVTGVPQAWRCEGPDHFPVQLTRGEDPTWVVGVAPDARFAVVSRDRRGDEASSLFLVPSAGGALQAVHDRPGSRAQLQLISGDSRWLYYTANEAGALSTRLFRWSTASHRRELVLELEGSWTVADWRPPGRVLLAKLLGTLAREYHEWRGGHGALKPLLGAGEEEEYDAAYGPGGELLVRTARFGEQRRLYRWRDGVYQPVTPEMRADVRSFHVDRARTRIVYEVNCNGWVVPRVLDARTFTARPGPRFRGAQQVRIGPASWNGRFQAFTVDRGVRPPSSYLFDWRAGQVRRLRRRSALEVDLESASRCAQEWYPARDGVSIPILVWRPRGERRSGPVVIDFHGGPDLQSLPGFNPVAQLFVQAGFIFAQPNIRGSDGYGKTWRRADDGARRLEVVADIADAALYFRRSSGRAIRRVGVMGQSYGGYAALLGVSLFAGAYDAAVAINPIVDLVDFLQTTAAYRRTARILEYGHPERDREVLQRLSPSTYLERVVAPTLIIQGTADPRCPPAQAIDMGKALFRRDRCHRLLMLPGEGHHAFRRGHRALQVGHALHWFSSHLR